MKLTIKIQQKYKGVRRIKRHQLIPKKQLTKYPQNYMHRRKMNIEDTKYCFYDEGYPTFREYIY